MAEHRTRVVHVPVVHAGIEPCLLTRALSSRSPPVVGAAAHIGVPLIHALPHERRPLIGAVIQRRPATVPGPLKHGIPVVEAAAKHRICAVRVIGKTGPPTVDAATIIDRILMR